MYSTLSYLCFLNLPFTALNIFILYSDISLLVFGQFITYKCVNIAHKYLLAVREMHYFRHNAQHYTNQYTRSLKIQWHSTCPCLFFAITIDFLRRKTSAHHTGFLLSMTNLYAASEKSPWTKPNSSLYSSRCDSVVGTSTIPLAVLSSPSSTSP